MVEKCWRNKLELAGRYFEYTLCGVHDDFIKEMDILSAMLAEN